MARPPAVVGLVYCRRDNVGLSEGDIRAPAAVYPLRPTVDERSGLRGLSAPYEPGDGDSERLRAVGADSELYGVPRPDE